MELLIPGLILVVLMVYASTRIKKTAAQAFEPETVETDEFVIEKPEGSLHVINGDPRYAFESYSKEFGGEGAQDIKQGRVRLHVIEGKRAGDALRTVMIPGEEKISEESVVVDGIKYVLTTTKRTEKGVHFDIQYRTADHNGKAYVLEAIRLSETTPEFARNIESMLDSFKLK